MREAEILQGIEAGARHLDCAAIYGNEAAVGRALVASGVPRSAFYLTTKVWNDWHRRVRASVERSLRDLQTDYVDLCLIHWPVSWVAGKPFCKDDVDVLDVWTQLSILVKEGKIRSLGVSNFDEAQLGPLLHVSPPCVVNQIEAHPQFQNDQLVQFCLRHGIQPVAWGPLGSKLDAAIALRWNLDRGVAVIPKSTKKERVAANLAVVDMPPLTKDQHDWIRSFDSNKRRFPDIIGIWASSGLLPRLFGSFVSILASLLFASFKVDLVACARKP